MKPKITSLWRKFIDRFNYPRIIGYCCIFELLDNSSPPSTNSLVDQTIARYDRVFSGRYHITIESGISDITIERSEILFSGNSWRRSWKHAVGELPTYDDPSLKKSGIDIASLPPRKGYDIRILVGLHDKLIEYTAIPQYDGTVAYNSRVSHEKEALASFYPPPPHFLGTAWFDRTRNFVTQNRTKAIHAGSTEINSMKAEILEWTVSGQGREPTLAFNSVNPIIENGGTLRLFVVPELGYVVPRVEMVGKSGEIGTLLEASSFKQINGIWLPQNAIIQYRPNQDGFRIKYTIEQISDINQLIPDTEFTIVLPEGTIISDSRSGTHSTIIQVKDPQSIPADLADVFVPEGTHRGAWYRRYWVAILGGSILGFLFLFGVRTLRRRLRARADG